VLQVSNSTMTGITYKISFNLRHRAQESGGVDVGLSVEHVKSNHADHQSQETGLGLHKVFGVQFPTYTLEPGIGDLKAMKVRQLVYEAFAGQTSVHPCDDNIIWVRLEAVDLKVLHSCNPTVTIACLMNTQTQD